MQSLEVMKSLVILPHLSSFSQRDYFTLYDIHACAHKQVRISTSCHCAHTKAFKGRTVSACNENFPVNQRKFLLSVSQRSGLMLGL